MKKWIRGLVCLTIMMVLLVQNVYASTPTWEQLADEGKTSELLTENEDEEVVNETARGAMFSTAVLRIYNGQDGTLNISVDTLAHVNVDSIYQSVFLDKWNEEKDAWVKVGYWEFERTKEEEENGELSSYHVDLTITGCEVNHYYRARAIHLVQLGDDAEGKSTQTNGVLLTDHEV